MGDRRTRHKPFGTSRGLGRWLRPTEGGADVRTTEAGIGRKGPLDMRTPGDDRDLGAGREWQNGGQPDEIRQTQARVRNSLWDPRVTGASIHAPRQRNSTYI